MVEKVSSQEIPTFTYRRAGHSAVRFSTYLSRFAILVIPWVTFDAPKEAHCVTLSKDASPKK